MVSLQESRLNPSDIFRMESEQDRINYMREMGALNMEAPLVRSSHLKILSTGQVVPWEHILSLQTDLVANCDKDGNTDPSAWMDTVNPEEYNEQEHQIEVSRAYSSSLAMRSMGDAMSSKFQVENAVDLQPQETGYPYGAVPADQVEKLLDMLK